MLPQTEWQAAPSDATQDDVDESDSEDPEAPDPDAAAATSGPEAQAEPAAEKALQQVQLHESASKTSAAGNKRQVICCLITLSLLCHGTGDTLHCDGMRHSGSSLTASHCLRQQATA